MGATTFKHNRNYACMCLEKPDALRSLAKGPCVSLKKVTFMPKLLADARSRTTRISIPGVLDSFHKLWLKFILRIGTMIRSNLCLGLARSVLLTVTSSQGLIQRPLEWRAKC